MAAEFFAKFAGKCQAPNCEWNGVISIGQRMTWVRRGEKAGNKYHKSCYDKLSPQEREEPKPEVPRLPESPSGDTGLDTAVRMLTEALSHAVKPADLNKAVNDAVAQAMSGYKPVSDDTIIELIQENIIRESHVTLTFPTGEKREIKGLVHKDVAIIAELLPVHRNVYIHGGAGAGKTHMAHQIAELLGLPCEVFQLGKLSPESGIKGFIDGNGNKQEQRFIAAFQKPCVIFTDEFDRWPSHLTTLMNSALANGYIDARGHETHITRHDQCYILAAGNTTMRGRDEYFPEAIAQEFSTIDRFFFYHVSYDVELERAVSDSINPNATAWVKWVQKLRPEAMSGKHGKVVATPRASYEGAKMLRYTSLPVAAIADGLVFKGIEPATREKLLTQFPLPEYTPESRKPKTEETPA